MEKIYDEVFTSGAQKIRHIWYKDLDLSVTEGYGKITVLSDGLIEEIVKTIEVITSEEDNDEYYFYFYRKDTAQDALEEMVRPTLFIRKKDEQIKVHFNVSDYEFAKNMDKIESYEQALIKSLTKG